MARKLGSKDKKKRKLKLVNIGTVIGLGAIGGSGVNMIGLKSLTEQRKRELGVSKLDIRDKRRKLTELIANDYRNDVKSGKRIVDEAKKVAVLTYNAKRDTGAKISDDKLREVMERPNKLIEQFTKQAKDRGATQSNVRRTITKQLKNDAYNASNKIIKSRLLGGAAIGALAAGGSYAVYKKLTSGKRKRD
jgi:hypothetical protein